MKKILILGAGAMGSAFTVPCVENSHDVILAGKGSFAILITAFIEKIYNNENTIITQNK